MAFGSESQITGAELEAVNRKLPMLFERDGPFYAAIEKKNVEIVSARDMRIPLELRPGGNFGQYNPDGGDLGLGEAPLFDKALINTVSLKIGFQLTKKAQWATDSARKSVVDYFKHTMAKAMPEFRRHIDALCMTSGNGVLGTVTAVTTTTVDTVTLSTDFGAKLLRYGQKVNVYDTTLATVRGADRTIVYIDYGLKQVQLSPLTTGIVPTDKLVISGVSGPNPVSLLGVPYHHNSASTGTWLGFDRATTPEIRANRVDGGAADFAIPMARLAINKIGDRVGIENDFNLEAWMHPAQVQQYESLAQAIQSIDRGSPRGDQANLYFEANTFRLAGAPVRQSFSWNKARIDFIDTKLWGRAEMHPAGMFDTGGRKIFELRGASGGVAASDIFYLTVSHNLFLGNPAAGAYIDNLLIPSGY
jgi:hypothetical protein